MALRPMNSRGSDLAHRVAGAVNRRCLRARLKSRGQEARASADASQCGRSTSNVALLLRNPRSTSCAPSNWVWWSEFAQALTCATVNDMGCDVTGATLARAQSVRESSDARITWIGSVETNLGMQGWGEDAVDWARSSASSVVRPAAAQVAPSISARRQAVRPKRIALA